MGISFFYIYLYFHTCCHKSMLDVKFPHLVNSVNILLFFKYLGEDSANGFMMF